MKGKIDNKTATESETVILKFLDMNRIAQKRTRIAIEIMKVVMIFSFSLSLIANSPFLEFLFFSFIACGSRIGPSQDDVQTLGLVMVLEPGLHRSQVAPSPIITPFLSS
jgi:hypothetical protein